MTTTSPRTDALEVGQGFFVPYDDINRMITKIIQRACFHYSLEYKDHHEDLRQEAWMIAVRKAPCYVPRGQKPTSYLWDWMSGYVAHAIKREYNYRTRSVQIENSDTWELLGGSVNGEVVENRELLDQVDPLLFMAGCGLKDIEIAALIDEPIEDVTKRRLAAQKELKASA